MKTLWKVVCDCCGKMSASTKDYNQAETNTKWYCRNCKHRAKNSIFTIETITAIKNADKVKQ